MGTHDAAVVRGTDAASTSHAARTVAASWSGRMNGHICTVSAAVEDAVAGILATSHATRGSGASAAAEGAKAAAGVAEAGIARGGGAAPHSIR